MDEAAAFRRASDGFVERARAITSEQWSAPTPCTEWDVRMLANHVAGEYLWVTEMMAGRTVADVGDRLDGDVLGAEPLETIIQGQRAALAAFEEPGAMERTVHLSFGDFPGTYYAKQMAMDSVIHAWDLARAIGASEELDPELVDMAYVELQGVADMARQAGVFGPEKDPADGSTQAKMLALSGR